MKKLFLGLLISLLLAILVLIVWPEKPYEPTVVDDAYQAQVDAYYLSDMPADWTWKSFVTQDGVRLRWGETGNKESVKATIIVVPGYTASMSMYGEHVGHLARAGFHVVGLDLRGQGGSERHRTTQPEKLWVEDFSVYSDDLAAFILSMEGATDRPLILTGISFGGHVATRAIGDHDLSMVDGLYLLAPAWEPKFGDFDRKMMKSVFNVGRMIGKSKHYMPGEKNWYPHEDYKDFTKASMELCSSNEKRLHLRDTLFVRQPEQRVGGLTVQWGAEFLESADYLQRKDYLEAIDLPVTVISASYDSYVDNMVISEVCSNHLGDCMNVIIPETGHCLLQENDNVLNEIYRQADALILRAQTNQIP